MASENQRKRKLASVEAPNEDRLNNSISYEGEIAISCTQNGGVTEVEKRLVPLKVFNDPVHGHIELPHICSAVIDTPQFQRLRNIKQLGGVYYVFPGATHNRFEHCIGTAWLAGRLAKTLQKRQPELHITETDMLCVQLAGLCHDLGHGPFSHMWDGMFMPKARPDANWKHEQGSVDLFAHMIEENNLMKVFQDYGLDQQDVTFIKELISGPLCSNSEIEDWPYTGRGIDKSYLYEIVSNKRSGVDVDKWDYFARDCYFLGISNNFDYKRYMKFARVVKVEGRLQICTRDKEVSTLYDMFHTRNSLNRRAYQHKTGKIIEAMFNEALLKADEHVRLPGKNGTPVKLGDCVFDMTAYTHLTDNIISFIEVSQDENLKEAKELLQRVAKRDLYTMIGQTILSYRVDVKDTQRLRDDIVSRMEVDSNNPEDYVVHIIEFNYGMKDKDPISQVRFYDKNRPNVAIRLKKSQVSQMLPEQFAEQHIRLYYKHHDQHTIEQATRAFQSWCKTMACSNPKTGNMNLELTPTKMRPTKQDSVSPVAKKKSLLFEDVTSEESYSQ